MKRAYWARNFFEKPLARRAVGPRDQPVASTLRLKNHGLLK